MRNHCTISAHISVQIHQNGTVIIFSGAIRKGAIRRDAKSCVSGVCDAAAIMPSPPPLPHPHHRRIVVVPVRPFRPTNRGGEHGSHVGPGNPALAPCFPGIATTYAASSPVGG